MRVFNPVLMIKLDLTYYFHEIKDRYQSISKQLLVEIYKDASNKRFVSAASERLLDSMLPEVIQAYEARFYSSNSRRFNLASLKQSIGMGQP